MALLIVSVWKAWAPGIRERSQPRRACPLYATVILVFALLGSPFNHRAFAADPGVQRNVVADFLYGADTQWETDDEDIVITRAFNDMLSDPVEKLRANRYPDYDLRPNKWPISVLLNHYFVPRSRHRYLTAATFFRDVKAPEAQRVIRVWANWLKGPRPRKRLPEFRPGRNVVAAYLNGAEEQSETEDQKAVIAQALKDMLSEPVEKLRYIRYPDYEMQPQQWSIIELLQRYFVPRSPLDTYPDETGFFRDVKKPQAQRAIRVWLSWLEGPDGPQPEYRPQVIHERGRSDE